VGHARDTDELLKVLGDELRTVVRDDTRPRFRVKFLGTLQDDLDVRLGHRLPQISVHDAAAEAVQNAAQAVKRPADVEFSGESRGFGFVEMPNKEEADKAIAGLNGKDLKGRTLTVNEARPRTDRPRTGGAGGRGGFGGGRGERGVRVAAEWEKGEAWPLRGSFRPALCAPPPPVFRMPTS
jgi:hypothetical protein